MPAPINVKLENPTISIPHWRAQAAAWMGLNTSVGGNPDFFPLTIKAAYIIGVIHTLCESVSHLLGHSVRQVAYIPAYGVFASGVELLGRCANGNSGTTRAVNDLKAGFKWLVAHPTLPDIEYNSIPNSHVVISTSTRNYTIQELAFLRHFAAHGQATAASVGIDYEILEHMRPLLSNGLGNYWGLLIESEELCNSLAKANVIAFRNWPVHASWSLFERDEHGRYHSVEEIFNRFDWRV